MYQKLYRVDGTDAVHACVASQLCTHGTGVIILPVRLSLPQCQTLRDNNLVCGTFCHHAGEVSAFIFSLSYSNITTIKSESKSHNSPIYSFFFTELSQGKFQKHCC